MSLLKKSITLACSLACLISLPGWAAKTKSFFEVTSKIGLETRLYNKDGLDSRQRNTNTSIWFQTELHKNWKEKKLTFTMTPYFRYDENDSERTHADLRNAIFHKTARQWELKVGLGKVFWGVTESQHLVDIINQTDLVDSPDGEDKLGQPMIHLILKPKSSTLEIFILPYFRERSFAGPDGRLRSTPYVDTDQTLYESRRKEKHVDYALRWSRTIKVWDIGLSFFDGTSRDPVFVAGTNGLGQPVLIPRYDQLQQLGLDLQATIGSWLWKLEAVSRKTRTGDYAAAVLGFEYTRSGFMKTRADVGFLLEYHYDDRNNPALTPFDDDLMLGTRIAFNDPASSQILVGIILDQNSTERSYFIEFSRRVKQHYTLSIEARAVSNTQAGSALHSQRNNNHIQLELIRYF